MRKTRSRKSTAAPSRRRRRRTNPAKSRKVTSRRRRVGVRSYRNPALGGLVLKGLEVAAGSALIQIISASVPQFGGASPVADAARTFGLGYLLALAAGKISPLKKYADSIALAGAALGAGKLIAAYLPIGRSAPRPVAAGPRPGSQPVGSGVGDIITMPRGSYDSYYGSTPNVPARGMGDIVTLPRRQNAY